MLRNVSLILIGAVLAGCATYYPLDKTAMPNAEVYYVPIIAYQDRNPAGLTSYRDLWAEIEIRSDLDEERRRCVLVHELMHAAGVWTHCGEWDCYMHRFGKQKWGERLSNGTLGRLMRAMDKNITIVCLTPEYRREVALVIGFLNEELSGRHPFYFILED